MVRILRKALELARPCFADESVGVAPNPFEASGKIAVAEEAPELIVAVIVQALDREALDGAAHQLNPGMGKLPAPTTERAAIAAGASQAASALVNPSISARLASLAWIAGSTWRADKARG